MPVIITIILLFVILLLKTSKFPFDLVESEHEISSGLFIEFGGLLFAILILCEYLLLLFFILVISFFMGSLFIKVNYRFSLVLLIVVTFFLVRSIMPNIKYTTCIMLSWKIILPLSVVVMVI